jgi:hypothetical protein
MPAKHACARRSHDRGMAKHHVWNPQSSYLQQPQFVVMNSVLNASANVEVR